MNFTARHNALNLAAAAAAYDSLGLPLDELALGAGDVAFSRWRGEEIELPGGGLLIADCYNANPTSMARRAAPPVGDRPPARRRVAVLGDMAELGAGAGAYHREVGELLAELGIELVVAVGPRVPRLRRHAGSPPSTRLREALADLIQPGDAVLVKASRSIGLEDAVEAIAP